MTRPFYVMVEADLDITARPTGTCHDGALNARPCTADELIVNTSVAVEAEDQETED